MIFSKKLFVNDFSQLFHQNSVTLNAMFVIFINFLSCSTIFTWPFEVLLQFAPLHFHIIFVFIVNNDFVASISPALLECDLAQVALNRFIFTLLWVQIKNGMFILGTLPSLFRRLFQTKRQNLEPTHYLT